MPQVFPFLDRHLSALKGLANAVIKPENIGQGTSLAFDLNGAFDSITYNKGGAVNRMFVTYLQDKWDQAMISHLNKFKFTNPTLDDLCNSLQQVVDNWNVQVALKGWVKQPGFPGIISFSETSFTVCSCTYRIQ